MSKREKKERIPDDAYITPQPLADAICAKLCSVEVLPRIVIEPSAGTGSFVRAARKVWPAASIRAVEPNGILPDGVADDVKKCTWEDGKAAGLFPTKPPAYGVLVLGNPPYNLPGDGRGAGPDGMTKPTTAERHVLLALERLGQWDYSTPRPYYLAFLLRQAFRATPARHERLFKKGGLRWLWTVVGRPSYTADLDASKGEAAGTEGAEYAVYVWQAGYQGKAEDGSIEWPYPRRERQIKLPVVTSSKKPAVIEVQASPAADGDDPFAGL